MRIPVAIRIAVLLAVAAGGPTCDADVAHEVGTFVRSAPKGATYTLIVPASYDRKKGATLLLWLHGAGDNHTNAARAFQARSFKPDWIVAIPDAKAQGSWQMEEDERVMDVVDEVQRNYTIRRSLIAGFSRGGYFTFGFGLNHTDRFVGYLCVAGGLPNPSLARAEDADEFHVAIVHGEADNVVPFQNGVDARSAFQKAGWKDCLFFRSVPGLAHRIDREATQAAFDWLDENAQSLETPEDYFEYGMQLLDREEYGRAYWAFSQVDKAVSGEEKWFRKLERALETIRKKSIAAAKKVRRGIDADRNAKWVPDWQRFHEVFDGTPAHEEVLAAYRALVAVHNERAETLFAEAQSAHDGGGRSYGNPQVPRDPRPLSCGRRRGGAAGQGPAGRLPRRSGRRAQTANPAEGHRRLEVSASAHPRIGVGRKPKALTENDERPPRVTIPLCVGRYGDTGFDGSLSLGSSIGSLGTASHTPFWPVAVSHGVRASTSVPGHRSRDAAWRDTPGPEPEAPAPKDRVGCRSARRPCA